MKLVAWRGWAALAVLAGATAISACSSGPDKLQPAELPSASSQVKTQLLWSLQVGASNVPLAPLSLQGLVYLAGGNGTVVAVDAATGVERWRTDLATRLSTGVGSDGQTTAVVTQDHHLVALVDGRERWRVQLPAGAFTAPLVAGRRVFVLGADRSVSAYDAHSGARLWTQARTGEPLVLRQSGLLVAVSDTLVVGLGGRVLGLNPLNGTPRWEAPVARTRGTNEVERLVDMVGPASRVGNSVCARSFNSAVGCVDTDSGRVAWSNPAQGLTGVGGDSLHVFGSEADGRLVVWTRLNGSRLWETDRLKYRELSAPLAQEKWLVVGDGTGLVHLLSGADGSELARLSTDGSAIVTSPVMAADALIVQTSKGGVFAWRPQ